MPPSLIRYESLLEGIVAVVLTVVAMATAILSKVLASANNCTGTQSVPAALLCTDGGQYLGGFLCIHMVLLGGLIALLSVPGVSRNIKFAAFLTFSAYTVAVMVFSYMIVTLPLFLTPQYIIYE
jgi:hypothetical protein